MSGTHPNADAANADQSYLVDGYKDRISLLCDLTADTSMSIEELLDAAVEGTVITDRDACILIRSDGTVNYNCTAADATAANGFIPNEYYVHGGKVNIDKVRLYAVGGLSTLTIIVSEVASTK